MNIRRRTFEKGQSVGITHLIFIIYKSIIIKFPSLEKTMSFLAKAHTVQCYV